MILYTKPSAVLTPQVSFKETFLGDGVTTELVTVNDGIFSRELATVNRWTAEIGGVMQGFTVENHSPEVLDTTNWPVVDRVSNGFGHLFISNGKVGKNFYLGMRDLADYTLVSSSFVEGSVGDYTWGILKPKLDAPNFERGLFLDSPTHFSTGNYNPNCWAASFDFSGVPLGIDFHQPWEAYPTIWPYERGGVLITPQHMWGVWHWSNPVGQKVRFASKTVPGLLVERTIIGVCQDDGPYRPNLCASNRAIGDRMIYTLDSPVPDSIKHYKLAGDWCSVNTENEAGVITHRCYQFVGLFVDQFRNVYLNAINNSYADYEVLVPPTTLYGTLIEDLYYGGAVIDANAPSTGMFAPYAEHFHCAVAGDSGSPSFVPLSETELAVWTLFTSPTYGMSRHEQVFNLLIANADANATSLGNLSTATGYTVTFAPNPT